MTDKKYEDRCEMCGDIIHTHYFESGYGGHSYGHKTIKEHEERRINLPERQYSLTLKVCMECQKKDPTLHKLVYRERIKWFDEEIEEKKDEIKRIRNQIKGLENSIPKEKKKLQVLKKKKEKLIKVEIIMNK